ncbi:unnamed protein product [Prunus armeniaca]
MSIEGKRRHYPSFPRPLHPNADWNSLDIFILLGIFNAIGKQSQPKLVPGGEERLYLCWANLFLLSNLGNLPSGVATFPCEPRSNVTPLYLELSNMTHPFPPVDPLVYANNRNRPSGANVACSWEQG